jgi:hypothetical protein
MEFVVKYPEYCFDLLECKTSFEQQVLSKFLEHQSFFLVIPLVDGEYRSFQATLNFISVNPGKYEYTSDSM